jgi:hypothetical protein
MLSTSAVPLPGGPAPIPEPLPPTLLASTVPPVIEIIPIDDVDAESCARPLPIPAPFDELVALIVQSPEIVILRTEEIPFSYAFPAPIPEPDEVLLAMTVVC